MFWILQSNLFNEVAFDSLVEQLERQNTPHVITKLRHFDHEFDPPVEAPPGRVWCCGSGAMQKQAIKHGWTPGYIAAPDYDVYTKILGDRVLNHDQIITTLRRVPDVLGDRQAVFIRPLNDSKSFTGQVMDRVELLDWVNKIESLHEIPNTFSTLAPHDQVVLSSPKTIYSEHRFYVVDGYPVTGSMYKQGTRVVYKENTDQELWNFAGQCAEEIAFPGNVTLCMRKAPTGPCTFALDVAVTPDGLKVIELNSLNSAGFYACDMGKYINAVNNMRQV
jgi:hypothetical protein